LGDSICSAMGSQGLEAQGDPTVMGLLKLPANKCCTNGNNLVSPLARILERGWVLGDGKLEGGFACLSSLGLPWMHPP